MQTDATFSQMHAFLLLQQCDAVCLSSYSIVLLSVSTCRQRFLRETLDEDRDAGLSSQRKNRGPRSGEGGRQRHYRTHVARWLAERGLLTSKKPSSYLLYSMAHWLSREI